MMSQLQDQINHMQPIVEAAHEFLQALQPRLQTPVEFDPFGPTPTYPTWPLDKRSFEALGKLMLAFRFAEPDSYVPPPASDDLVITHIYNLLHKMWPDYDTIEGPFIIYKVVDPSSPDMLRTWLANIYLEPQDTWVGVRGWVQPDGSPTISHTARLKRRRGTVR